MRWSVEAILLDIDGTLVDSTPAVERTWRTWAVRHGLDAAEILLRCHGRRSEDTIADLLPESQRAAAVTELEQLELDDLDDVVPLPGARPLLESLPPDRWAAVTSGSRRLMRARLSAAGLPVPVTLISAEDVTAGKPDPAGYLKAAAALGCAPARCMVVEDAPAGIEAGLRARAAVLAVATTHDPAELTHADQVIADLTDCAVIPARDRLDITVVTKATHSRSSAMADPEARPRLAQPSSRRPGR